MANEQILKALRESKRTVINHYSMIFFTRNDLDKAYTRLMLPLQTGNVENFDKAYGEVLHTNAGSSLIDALFDCLPVDSYDDLMDLVKSGVTC